MRFVFVVTYGRSGSTLLQSILNSIDGYKICGENFNALYYLYKTCQMVTNTVEKQGRVERNGVIGAERGWMGANEVEYKEFVADMLNSFITRVLRPTPETRVLGFKEIRYSELNYDEFHKFLNFISEHFPGAKFIFNKRKPADVAQSS